MVLKTDLYRRNGKAANPSPKCINDRPKLEPKRSMIGPCVEDIARQLREVFPLHASILRLSSHQKPVAAFEEKGGVTDNRARFLSGYTELFRAIFVWYNVVMACIDSRGFVYSADKIFIKFENRSFRTLIAYSITWPCFMVSTREPE